MTVNGLENLGNLKINGQNLSADVTAALTTDGGDITITRTIDGSPTLQMTLILDRARTLFKSGLLASVFRANFHGFDFEVAQIRKSKNRVTIVMEDLAVAELRRHSDPYVATAGSVTRVQFVRQLLQKECNWITLNVDPSVQEPVAAVQLGRGTISTPSSDQVDPNFYGDAGSSTAVNPTGQYATNTILTAAQIAGAAKAAGFSGSNLVTAIAVALAESGGNPSAKGTNLGGDAPGSHDLGLWQINDHYHADLLGQYIWSDPLSNAKMAWIVSGHGTNWGPWATYTTKDAKRSYKQFVPKAQAAAGAPATDYATVNATAASTATGGEDSWTCFKRIFNEVGWRLYADHGQLYAGPDSAFIDKDPIVTLREFQGGVNYIDYDFDTGKPTSTVNIDALVDSWVVQPGSVMEIPDAGLPITKWLCSSIQRSLVSRQTKIVGTSPQPELPEPASAGGSVDYDGDPATTGSGAVATGGASNGRYIWPVTARNITAAFGEDRPGHTHKGIDIGCAQGSQVVASAPGVVLQADNSNPGGYGNAVFINHDNGDQTRYGHLSAFNCRAGQSVKQGQQIGLSGGKPGTPGAGDATGPHLHFEIQQSGKPVNPLPLLSNAAPYDSSNSVATPGPGKKLPASGGGGGSW